jgi:hypothetical protein
MRPKRARKLTISNRCFSGNFRLALTLGVPVTVERLDLNRSEQIVAICKRGRSRQLLPILDLPLPTPPPDGAEWVEAYRRWLAEG